MIRSILGETFDDYVVITRLRSRRGTCGTEDGFYWVKSDDSWALGAVQRLSDILGDESLSGYQRSKGGRRGPDREDPDVDADEGTAA